MGASPSADPSPRLLTIEQVAQRCQVSSKTVYRAIRRGALRASRLGAAGAYRIKPEEMESWIDGSSEAPAPMAAASDADTGRARTRVSERRPMDGQLHLSPGMGRRS